MCPNTVSTKFFDSESQPPFSLIFSTIFTINTFCQSKIPSRNPLRTNRLFYYIFYANFLPTSFKNRTFSQNHRNLSLYFKQFYRDGVLNHSKNLPTTTIKNLNNSLTYSQLKFSKSDAKHVLDETTFRPLFTHQTTLAKSSNHPVF